MYRRPLEEEEEDLPSPPFGGNGAENVRYLHYLHYIYLVQLTETSIDIDQKKCVTKDKLFCTCSRFPSVHISEPCPGGPGVRKFYKQNIFRTSFAKLHTVSGLYIYPCLWQLTHRVSTA